MNSQTVDDRPETLAADSGATPPDPPPPEAAEVPDIKRARAVDVWLRRAASIAVIGIFVILLGAFLQAGRVFLLPIASAIIIGSMLAPLAKRAERLRISPAVFAT